MHQAFFETCKEQNLDPEDITNCVKEEMPKIQGVTKWRLQNGVEIVVGWRKIGLFSLRLLVWRSENGEYTDETKPSY